MTALGRVDVRRRSPVGVPLWRRVDLVLVAATFAVASLGTVMVYSATRGTGDVPDTSYLDRTEIDLSEMSSGGGDLPDDLVDLLRTADVTNITERSKLVAERMFADETPTRVAEIQGAQAGLLADLDQIADAVYHRASAAAGTP